MEALLRTARLAGQEPALLDYVQRLHRFRKGRRAVHVRFSRLRPQNRLEPQLRIAATSFDRLIRTYESSLFRLHNGDMMLVIKGAAAAEIDAVIAQLRCLFSEDPAVNTPDGEPEAFIAWYDVETGYERLLAVCQALEDERRQAATGRSAPADGTAGRPLDPAELARVERAIGDADLTVVLRRQPVVFSQPDHPPLPLLHELYISTADLGRIVVPGWNLTANRWLFQHLTGTLDRRMLALLMRRREPALGRDFSLNLNVSTVLSPEFLQFDREVAAACPGKVMIELQQIDIFADPGSFLFAREFLRERGYKICLDGVRHLALPLIDRAGLGVDFVKFEWGYGLVDDHDGPRGADLMAAVDRIGRDRLILCRCDSPEALRVGRAMGINLYQGRYFDGLLKEADGAPGRDSRTVASA
ncbi:MAG: EAL domain-containing protein [Rhodospirillaceae bacterium]|nr:EAL domain-containing protein [Rhodospirillaceae bacterium]